VLGAPLANLPVDFCEKLPRRIQPRRLFGWQPAPEMREVMLASGDDALQCAAWAAWSAQGGM
jgi:hypothetical protein